MACDWRFPAAARLSPLPRNFQKGFFKFRTTPSYKLPTEADLMRTITNGLPGSSMPGFVLVPELQRCDVVAYVQHLVGYGFAKLEAEVLRDTQKLSAEIIRKTGIGDGSSSQTLRDWQGAVILPRDFTSGVFRAGSTNADLYIRLKTGLNGTPMPSVTGSDQDLWDLTQHIRSLVTAPSKESK